MQLEAELLPVGSESNVTWTTSNAAIAAVQDGTVTALGRGDAIIMAASDNGLTAAVLLTVKGVPAEKVTLLNVPETLAVGDTFPLKARIDPAEAEDENPAWTGDAHAGIDEAGTMTGLVPGMAMIRASAASGRYDEAELFIYEPVTGITLPEGQETVRMTAVPGTETFRLTPEVIPADATVTELEYLSDDETVVTVDDGLLTAVKPGEAVITIRTEWTHERIPVSTQINILVEAVELSETSASEPDIVWGDLEASAPAFELTYGDYRLVMGTDYTVSPDPDRTSGWHTATLTGKGCFTGTMEIPYEICSRPVPFLSCGTVTLACGQTVWAGSWTVFDDAASDRVRQAYAAEWTSGDETIVSVTENGVLTALRAGDTTVTVSGNHENPLTATMTVHVAEGSGWRTLELPMALRTIEEEAFAGIAAEVVTAGPQLQSIGANAFLDAVNLRQIVLAGNPDTVSENALAETDAVLLIPEGAQIENTLREYGISYVLEQE